MKSLTSHNYKLQEIESLRDYNRKTFFIPKKTKERIVSGFGIRKKEYYGEVLSELYIKPIHYMDLNNRWQDLSEIAYYFGNKKGLILKENWYKQCNTGYLIWYLKRNRVLKGKGIRIGIEQGMGIKKLELPLLLNTTSTFYPDPNPETTSVDGQAAITGQNASFGTLRGGNGDTAADSGTGLAINLRSTTTSNQYLQLYRTFLLFDSSSIPDTDSISAATMSFYATDKTDAFDQSVSMMASAPASNTAIVAADYQNGPSFVRQATDIDVTSITTAAYNDFTLNATGISNISKTGVSKFGIIFSGDMDNSAPTWASDTTAEVVYSSADTAGTTQDPKLVVTHAAAVTAQKNLMMLGVGS